MESELEIVRFYFVINKYSLEKWVKYEFKDLLLKDLNEREVFEQRFLVDSGNQVIYVCDCWNVCDNLWDILDSYIFENSRFWCLIMFLIMLDQIISVIYYFGYKRCNKGRCYILVIFLFFVKVFNVYFFVVFLICD